MKNEKQKFIDIIFAAAKKKDQDNLDKLVHQSSILINDSEVTISYDEWKTAHQHYQKKINQQRMVKISLSIFGSLILFLFLAFAILFFIRKPTAKQLRSGNIGWVLAPTKTVTPTMMPLPTSTLEPTLTPTSALFDEDEGWISDIETISPTLPISNPDKVWLIDQADFVWVLNMASKTDIENFSYLSQGDSVSIHLDREMNPGIYQICYLEPVEHSTGEYPISVMDGVDLINPLNAGTSQLTFLDDSIQETERWACLGYFSIPSTPNFSIQGDIKIEQEGNEFPMTQMLIMRLADEEDELISDLKTKIPENSSIVSIVDDEGFQIDSSLSKAISPGYWGTGFTKLDGMEPGTPYIIPFPGEILLGQGDYQIAVHVSMDACRANEEYSLVKFEDGKKLLDLEIIPGDKLSMSSDNCTDQWVVGGQWILDEKQLIKIRCDATTDIVETSAGFDAVAIIKTEQLAIDD